ncbi:MAG: OsmC family protein [Bacillota bacterium]
MPGEVMNVQAIWVGERDIEAETSSGERIGMAESDPRPTEYLLASVAGCAGETFLRFVSERGFEVEAISIEVTGRRAEAAPEVFEHILVTFEVIAPEVSEEELDELLQLTDRYCPIVQSLVSGVEIVLDLKTI